jgi:type IV secretory pathway TraG/TraD family ATPase VirD4
VSQHGELRVSIVEGESLQRIDGVIGSAVDRSRKQVFQVLRGLNGALRFDQQDISKHVLFIGGIGTGKTNAMKHLVQSLRQKADDDDVFVVFDTKADFVREFYRPGDAVISSAPDSGQGGERWNLFSDLLDEDRGERSDQIYEISSTIFGDATSPEGQNYFFGAAARDIFAAVVEAMHRDETAYSNADLREQLEASAGELRDLLAEHPDLAGSARYLHGDRTAEQILAFLQQTLNTSFSGVFREAGTFSVRDFIRRKGGRTLFIEYDVSMGSRLSPIYRVLMDLAIKEALGLGRQGSRGSVFFVMDEFALLPKLSHIGDGINFGRSLGLKFLVGTQNVNQVLHAYGAAIGASILSGFGTVLAFRLMDSGSRDLVRERYGANRKQITTFAPVRSEGVQQVTVMGNVIEDWDMSRLGRGECIVCFPEGPPRLFQFAEYIDR